MLEFEEIELLRNELINLYEKLGINDNLSNYLIPGFGCLNSL